MTLKAIVRNLRVGVALEVAVLTMGSNLARGTPPGSLQVNVVRVERTSTPLLFEVRLHNAGDKALILNLGMMLANGRQQYPDAIHLRLAKEHGQALLLDLIGPAILGSRVDPLVMPLPQGATFSFPVKLADYCSPEANVWKIDLAPGKYTLSAEYKGTAVPQRGANFDMQGIALMPYWIGVVESKTLSFRVRPAVEGKHE